MALDQVANFIKVTVSQGYSLGATSIILATGQGALMPNPASGQYNVVWYNATDYVDPSDDPNVEVVRVTAIAVDTITVTRAQEGTSATQKQNVGKVYKFQLGITAKMITDIQAALNAAGATVAVTGELVGGSGTAWTLANTPIAGTVKLYSGVRLNPPGDYSISGASITTVNSFPTGSLYADYNH